MPQQRGDRLSRRRHVGVAEHDERHRARRRYEPHGGPGDHAERPLGAGEEPGHVEVVLGEQVLERVARDLPGEPPELGPDQAETIADQAVQSREHGHFGLSAPREAVPAVAAGGETHAGHGQQVGVDDIVGRPPVGQRARAARVVAQAAPDGGSRVGRGIRAESQPVFGRSGRHRVEDRPRFHAGRSSLRVDGEYPVEVPREVDHDTGSDRVASDRRPGAAAGHWHPETAAHREDGLDLVPVAREDDRARDDPVVRGVGGVFGPPPSGRVDVADARPMQLRGELGGRDGSHPDILPDPDAYRP